MHLEKNRLDEIQNGRFSAIIHFHMQGFPQSVQASWHHDALIFYPDASVSAVTL